MLEKTSRTMLSLCVLALTPMAQADAGSQVNDFSADMFAQTAANTSAWNCAACHQEIVPFQQRPTKDERVARLRFKTEERRWKLLGGFLFDVPEFGELEIRAYGRTQGLHQRLYEVKFPLWPTRYFLPATQGENPHDILAR